jgi:F-BAR domain only protein
LEAIGPNRIFVTNAPSHPDQFSVDLSHLQKTTIGFSYKVHVDPAVPPVEHLPILITPAWKPQGDKLGLLLQYKPNPAFKFASTETPVQLHNVVLFATYEGKASGAQTKPSGTHLKEKHLVYWRLGDLTLSPSTDWQKIVCRIIGEQGAEPMPGTVEARWEYVPPVAAGSGAGEVETARDGISVSRLEQSKGKNVELSEDDPFADADENTVTPEGDRWVEVPRQRKVISGKFEAS